MTEIRYLIVAFHAVNERFSVREDKGTKQLYGSRRLQIFGADAKGYETATHTHVQIHTQTHTLPDRRRGLEAGQEFAYRGEKLDLLVTF